MIFLALIIMVVLTMIFEATGVPINIYTLWLASYIAWYYTESPLMLLGSTILMWGSVLSLLFFVGGC